MQITPSQTPPSGRAGPTQVCREINFNLETIMAFLRKWMISKRSERKLPDIPTAVDLDLENAVANYIGLMENTAIEPNRAFDLTGLRIVYTSLYTNSWNFATAVHKVLLKSPTNPGNMEIKAFSSFFLMYYALAWEKRIESVGFLEDLLNVDPRPPVSPGKRKLALAGAPESGKRPLDRKALMKSIRDKLIIPVRSILHIAPKIKSKAWSPHTPAHFLDGTECYNEVLHKGTLNLLEANGLTVRPEINEELYLSILNNPDTRRSPELEFIARMAINILNTRLNKNERYGLNGDFLYRSYGENTSKNVILTYLSGLANPLFKENRKTLFGTLRKQQLKRHKLRNPIQEPSNDSPAPADPPDAIIAGRPETTRDGTPLPIRDEGTEPDILTANGKPAETETDAGAPRPDDGAYGLLSLVANQRLLEKLNNLRAEQILGLIDRVLGEMRRPANAHLKNLLLKKGPSEALEIVREKTLVRILKPESDPEKSDVRPLLSNILYLPRRGETEGRLFFPSNGYYLSVERYSSGNYGMVGPLELVPAPYEEVNEIKDFHPIHLVRTGSSKTIAKYLAGLDKLLKGEELHALKRLFSAVPFDLASRRDKVMLAETGLKALVALYQNEDWLGAETLLKAMSRLGHGFNVRTARTKAGISLILALDAQDMTQRAERIYNDLVNETRFAPMEEERYYTFKTLFGSFSCLSRLDDAMRLRQNTDFGKDFDIRLHSSRTINELIRLRGVGVVFNPGRLGNAALDHPLEKEKADAVIAH
ncbi:MAG: hypothetical protein LBF41_09040, partial [Deltaproteobacteria bacterium]|nr:hypothetical protein [Deltaproteobacteria bacterium]